MIINVRRERAKQRKRRKHVSRHGLAKWLYGIIKYKKDQEHSSYDLFTFEDFKDWLLKQENFEWKYFNWEDHGFSKYHAFPRIIKMDKNKPFTLDNIKLV
jgi:hypothetical protein